MSNLEEILEFNKAFVQNKEYEKYSSTRQPIKKMVVLSCMDTRLTELLPKALNFKNGDIKLVKNAGATILDPFDSIVRSIVVAVYEFHAKEVLVIGHHGCGMSHIDPNEIVNKALERGISPDVISTLTHSGIQVEHWLKGFTSVEESIKESVDIIRNHPLIPQDVVVHGLIMNPETGAVDVVVNGYTNKEK